MEIPGFHKLSSQLDILSDLGFFFPCHTHKGSGLEVMIITAGACRSLTHEHITPRLRQGQTSQAQDRQRQLRANRAYSRQEGVLSGETSRRILQSRLQGYTVGRGLLLSKGCSQAECMRGCQPPFAHVCPALVGRAQSTPLLRVASREGNIMSNRRKHYVKPRSRSPRFRSLS